MQRLIDVITGTNCSSGKTIEGKYAANEFHIIVIVYI